MPGVFISEGMQLRIPAGSLTLRIRPDGGLDIPPVRFEVALDVWPFWLDVAIDHASSALQVRKELTEAINVAGEENVDGTVKGDLLAGECKAGMVAIAASAFALDNFYAVIQRFTPAGVELEARFEVARTARHRRVSETIRRTFAIPNPSARRLHESVREVFRFRHWAVHPPAGFREPAKHDFLDVGVEWRFVAFRASNAVVATRAAASIIDECVNAPRTSNGPLAAWCEGHRGRSQARYDRVKQELGAEKSSA